MNWEVVGAIGELVGAAAVIATLFFLAIQVRHSAKATEENTRFLKASIIRSGDDSIADFSYRLALEPGLNQLWIDGAAAQELSENDQIRFFHIARNFFGIHAVSYFEFKASGDQVAQDKLVNFVAEQIQANPGLKHIWEFLPSTPFSSYSEFINFVNARIDKLQVV